MIKPTEAAWLEFKAKQDKPELPACPFCGICHTPAKTHPYCDMATLFKFSIGVST